MRLDVHVHVSAMSPGHGHMSRCLLDSIPFRFMRRHFGLVGEDESAELALEQILADTLEETIELDAAVILAFDAVYAPDGRRDEANTHLYVTNDYAIQLASRHRKMRFGASVHPYRPDAIAELERCIAAGAVLCKWLPLTQGFDPADPRCMPFYECLAHHGLPLLCHTGAEHALPVIAPHTADPSLLTEALRRGVRVIAAHCASRLWPTETDYFPVFCRMAREHEHLYGDTSALNVPLRGYALRKALADPAVRDKLVHGSDWPIWALPPLRLGIGAGLKLIRQRNWLRRDLQIKQALGMDKAYWERAARVLRLGQASDGAERAVSA